MIDALLHVATGVSFERKGDTYWPERFETEGFIHACTPAQLEGVLSRYFENKSDLYLLEIDQKKLTVPVKMELSSSGEMFPHIYGKVNRDAIVKVRKLR
jgi:uncharacterized protein (DUF952 family)